MVGRKLAKAACCLLFAGAVCLPHSASAGPGDAVTPWNISPANGTVFYASKNPISFLPDIAKVPLKFQCTESESAYYWVEVSGLGLLGTTGVNADRTLPVTSKSGGTCTVDYSYGYESGTFTWRPILIGCWSPNCEGPGHTWSFAVRDKPRDPGPGPNPGPDPDLDTRMSLPQAKYYTRSQTKKRFFRTPFRVNCWRKSYSSFGCFSFFRKNWRNNFRAKWVFIHIIDENELWYTTRFKRKRRYLRW
jgi:hypothetical protein